MENPPPKNTLEAFFHTVGRVIDAPVTWFRESVVVPNRRDHVYYHQKFRRVPTIDECYTDDMVCKFEAQQQFNRDKLVDGEIVNIIRMRLKECTAYEGPDHVEKCKKLREDFDKVSENFFIKYGDIGPLNSVFYAYMKQKHRLLWERRHGPVGTGMKSQEEVH